MHCAGCAALIENALSKLDGVTRARVNLMGGQASVQFEPERIGSKELVAALTQGGYLVHVIEPDEDLGAHEIEKELRERSAWRRRLIVGAAFLAVQVVLVMGGMLTSSALWWSQFLVATVLQFFVGWPYFVGAYLRARSGAANMDTLIALGTGAAYASGWFSSARP